MTQAEIQRRINNIRAAAENLREVIVENVPRGLVRRLALELSRKAFAEAVAGIQTGRSS